MPLPDPDMPGGGNIPDAVEVLFEDDDEDVADVDDVDTPPVPVPPTFPLPETPEDGNTPAGTELL